MSMLIPWSGGVKCLHSVSLWGFSRATNDHSVGKYFKTMQCPACPQSPPPRFSAHRWLMLVLIFSMMITGWQFPAPVLSPLVPVSSCYFTEPSLLFCLPVTYLSFIHPSTYLFISIIYLLKEHTLQLVGSSSLTKGQTYAPCFGNVES